MIGGVRSNDMPGASVGVVGVLVLILDGCACEDIANLEWGATLAGVPDLR
jgi:hypothetical protein